MFQAARGDLSELAKETGFSLPFSRALEKGGS